jgi:hypothetical protein
MMDKKIHDMPDGNSKFVGQPYKCLFFKNTLDKVGSFCVGKMNYARNGG